MRKGVNIIDDLCEHISNQEYITCMNALRDKRIKTKYETFMSIEHPELIDEAVIYIMKRSGYDDFDFCGRHFDINTFDPSVFQ
jgi:hypothetical protein